MTSIEADFRFMAEEYVPSLNQGSEAHNSSLIREAQEVLVLVPSNRSRRVIVTQLEKLVLGRLKWMRHEILEHTTMIATRPLLCQPMG